MPTVTDPKNPHTLPAAPSSWPRELATAILLAWRWRTILRGRRS